jgi:hypothetical protein
MRFLLPLLLAASPLAAQENLFIHVPDPKSKAKVEATALFSRPAPGGFLPVRLTVTNPSDDDRAFEISATSAEQAFGNQGSELRSRFSLTAPAGKTSRHDILVPCTTSLDSDCSQTINLALSGSFGTNSGGINANFAETQPVVLLSEPLFTPNASALDAAAASTHSSRYGGTSFAGKFDPRELPEDWRAYSGYDTLVLTDTDWGVASPGARNAILQWNRLGGSLVIYAVSSTSDLATLGIAAAGKGVRSAERSFGSVAILPIGSDLKLDASKAVSAIYSSGKLPPLNASIRSDFSSGWPLQQAFGQARYNHTLFILILIAFGILVGPVNLFVFAKSGRRHRLFITTPLIALGTSVLLIALILLIDGFGGRGARTIVMEVRPDDGENSAYVLQEQISRTGVLFGGGFTLAESAALSPVPIAPSQWARLTPSNYGGGMRYEANPQDGKLAIDGDWFQSRSEQGHLVRAIVPTRGRIEARSDAGPPTFLSTFDFPIQTLWFSDPSGGLWRAEGIVPGKAFTCQQTTAADFTAFTAFTSEMAKSLSPRSRTAVAPLPARMGHFIAVTDAAPGIDTFRGIQWQSTRAYITGPVVEP